MQLDTLNITRDKLSLSFYQQDDVVELSQLLIGKVLVSYIDNRLTSGIIVETEAYRAPDDRASHAYGMRRTKRNQMMYEAGGYAYVYLCYGIHPLLNIVTNKEGMPHAILIRAIEPINGIDTMLERRKLSKLERRLTAGPGAAARALGITMDHNGLPLTGSRLWIQEGLKEILPENIIASPRVGIDYAKEDALLPWRFRLKASPWTSPAK
ncbi:MAG: DNA-3-methyladenine glycosylase [Candidatus Protochlamydia sp.]|nr:DNA-3-methyladenine glycosylase [Candidatus Protochlamydia sp.]